GAPGRRTSSKGCRGSSKNSFGLAEFEWHFRRTTRGGQVSLAGGIRQARFGEGARRTARAGNCHELRVVDAHDIRSVRGVLPAGCSLTRKANGPGTAKTKALAIGSTRTLELWQSADYRLRDLLRLDQRSAALQRAWRRRTERTCTRDRALDCQ